MDLSTPILIKATVLVLFPALTVATPVVEGLSATNLIRRNLDPHSSIGHITSDAECIPYIWAMGPGTLFSKIYTNSIISDEKSIHTYKKDDTVAFGCWRKGMEVADPNGALKTYYSPLNAPCWVDGDQIRTEVGASPAEIKECMKAA